MKPNLLKKISIFSLVFGLFFLAIQMINPVRADAATTYTIHLDGNGAALQNTSIMQQGRVINFRHPVPVVLQAV